MESEHCLPKSFDRARRRVLRWIAATVSTASLARSGIALGAPPPKESGLSFEGLLKDQPGFQPRSPAPLAIEEIPGFLSKRQLATSYGAYRRAFAALSEAEAALQGAIRDEQSADRYAELRGRQLQAANSVLLHELYFRNLSTKHVEPSRYVLANMNEHIGTMDTWREDFTACARVAEAWAVLSYDPYDDRWHDLPLAAPDAGGLVGANPLVVCDVSKEAWGIDYEQRSAYIAGFLDHIDWAAVAARYRAVDRQ